MDSINELQKELKKAEMDHQHLKNFVHVKRYRDNVKTIINKRIKLQKVVEEKNKPTIYCQYCKQHGNHYPSNCYNKQVHDFQMYRNQQQQQLINEKRQFNLKVNDFKLEVSIVTQALNRLELELNEKQKVLNELEKNLNEKQITLNKQQHEIENKQNEFNEKIKNVKIKIEKGIETKTNKKVQPKRKSKRIQNKKGF